MRHLGTLLVISWLFLAPDASAQVARRPFLFKDARGELAQARARGETDVLLVIASMPGRNGQVAAAVAQFGGTIQFRDDDVDYLRARVPIEHVEEVVAHAGVHSVDISITGRSRTFGMANVGGDSEPVLPLTDESTAASPFPVAAAGAVASIPVTGITTDTIPQVWPPVLSDYPLTNRYHPWGDLRALGFLEENPTYDGRGVKVAMIDMNPDMLVPELQVARSLDGQTIPKIAAFGTALDIEEEDDGRWVRMTDMVEGTGGEFSYKDTTYTAPRDGTFRIGFFDEAKADTVGTYGTQGLDMDVNRDGNPEGTTRLFGVLWDESTNDVWVDTD